MSSRCASCSYPLSVCDSVVCYECSSYFHIDCAQLVGFPCYELNTDPNKNTFHCRTCELLPLPTRQSDSDSDSECGMPSRQLDYHLDTQGDLSKDMNEIKGNIQDLSNLCKDMLREINEIKSINLTLRCCVENLRHENEERDTIISELKLRLEYLEGGKKLKSEKISCVNKNMKTDSGDNYGFNSNIEDSNINICMSSNDEDFQKPTLECQNQGDICKPQEMKENRQDWTWRDKTAIEFEKEEENAGEVVNTQESEVESWELLSTEIESQRTLNKDSDFELNENTESNNDKLKLFRGDTLESDIVQQTSLHDKKYQAEIESTKTLEESDEEETESESEPETILDDQKALLSVNSNNVSANETFFRNEENALRTEDHTKIDIIKYETENPNNVTSPLAQCCEEEISAFDEDSYIGSKSAYDTGDAMTIEIGKHDEQNKQFMEEGDKEPHEVEVKEVHSERKFSNVEAEIIQSQNVAMTFSDELTEDEETLSTRDNTPEPIIKELRHEDLIEVEVGEIPEEKENEESLHRAEEDDSEYLPENLETSYETGEFTEPAVESNPLIEGEACENGEEQHLEEPHVEGEELAESEHRLEDVPQVLVSEVTEGALEVDGEQRLGGQSQEEEVQPSEPSQSQQPNHTEEDLWHYLKEAVTSERPSTVEEFLQNLIGTLQHVPEEYLEPVIAANIKRANSPCSTDGETHRTSDEMFVEQSEAGSLESDPNSKGESITMPGETASVEEVAQEVPADVPETETNATSDSEGLSTVEADA